MHQNTVNTEKWSSNHISGQAIKSDYIVSNCLNVIEYVK